ncbi:39S ribosomal protein L9, mitochondrial [Erpetoichthys calabaricus]|uniref:Large ribosomal subunit protein bL9m n=1 Tax=Erpetoichthys calabaricus TaxID=27687 RepID=A0A8C4RF80_ERPCA|nr:39S ribosomal protein L9, mitochondrial [Erpetoichthys calabaricus]
MDDSGRFSKQSHVYIFKSLRGFLNDFSSLSAAFSFSTTSCRSTVIVERWWNVPLSKEGKPPRLHPRRHKVFKFVEDTKHSSKVNLELILTLNVAKLGSRGDVVFVKKSLGRNKLLPEGLAVYASPENKALFEQEKERLLEKPEERVQTQTGELTVAFLKKCHLTVYMRTDITYQLNKDIVCRQMLRKLGVFVPPHALTLPEEPITTLGEYWCDVTVNGIQTVRIPMSVVSFETQLGRKNKHSLEKQSLHAETKDEESKS